ncbi:sorbosone dehydrogenase family protein [Microbacterium sp. SLBN-146]|uniref:PQQ-dependent sugar dehydrogenase n=1 Tax=Microbacterium sp. SLBN-146 TaxID=2768457 RepID=UPI0011713A13|nr:PQQ-dependent sugar dehydrogenase [Microbacterium sp. SLBN-146]TQJ32053.1 glucose/arabinose dehydrogenase [Microbacterium sp. SLBN-146]
MTWFRMPRAAAAVIAVAVVASGCAASPTAEPPPPTSPRPTSEPTGTATPPRSGSWTTGGAANTLVGGLAAPWSVVPLPDGGALISERDSGIVRELTTDGSLRTAGTVPGVVSGGESGLHGLALLDGETPWLYAYHGTADDNRVVRMALTGPAGALTLGDVEVVYDGIPRASTHNGGRIAFGPDDLLYVATGDAQNRDAAQNVDALGGKILRLTPEGDAAPGNPFESAVWSYGHRNVQGIAWTSDGTMWASEFGQNTWDELNVIEPGANYGWPVVEGVAEDSRFIDPVVVWSPSESSPSGIAAVGETVFVAGLRGERLWRWDAASGTLDTVFSGQGRLRDVIEGPDESLWVLTNNTDGRGAPRPEDDLLVRLPLAAG